MSSRGRSAILVLALASACARRPLTPEEIPLDRASCARCGMVVSDPATAAETVSRSRDARFYDDVGCLASDAGALEAGSEAWVRVDGGKAWRKAAEASYARPGDARTPMGYGFLAFSSSQAASAVDRDRKAWAWEELRREVALPARQEGKS